MSVMTIEQLYQQYVKPLSISERLQLVALIAQQLTQEAELKGIESEPSETITTVIKEERGTHQYVEGLIEAKKGSPGAILKLAHTLQPEEAEAILQAAQACRRIDWEMWE